jgi:hypothetical protein
MDGKDYSRFLTKKNPETDTKNNYNNYNRVKSPQLLLGNNKIKNIQIQANPIIITKNVSNPKQQNQGIISQIKFQNNHFSSQSNTIPYNDNNKINNVNKKYSFDKRVLMRDSRINDYTNNTKINFELYSSSKKSSSKNLLNNKSSDKMRIKNNHINNSVINNSNNNNKISKQNKKVYLNNSFDYNSPATSYLNRRHTQEMERLKKFKEKRDQRYSFVPKINKNSEKIVKRLAKEKFIPIIPKEEIDNIFDENYQNINNNKRSFQKSTKDSFRISNENELSYQNTSPNKPPSFEFNDQKKLLQDITNYLNTKQENENNPNFLLNHDSRNFVLERMKAIQIKQKEKV